MSISQNSEDPSNNNENTNNKELHKRFLAAVELAKNTDILFPPDVRLLFYSFYKRAVESYEMDASKTTDAAGSYDYPNSGMVTAFKINALMQTRSSYSKEECKEKYIELVEKHIGKI